MLNSDRWVGDERRAESRTRLAIDIEWDASEDIQGGTLSDLNSGGCFILASGYFLEGQTVRVYFPLSDGSKFEMVGVIANQFSDLGFALRFVDVTDIQQQFLNDFAALHETS